MILKQGLKLNYGPNIHVLLFNRVPKKSKAKLLFKQSSFQP